MALRLPLTLTPAGSFAEVPDGSPVEIAQSVGVLLATRVGERRSEPQYGSTDAVFTPLGTPIIDTASVQFWEPRATDDVVTIAASTYPVGSS